MLQTLFRVLAWLAILFIIAVTVSPIALRPHDLFSVNTDRALAFAVTSFIFMLAYPRHGLIVAGALVIGAYLIEAFQLLQPTRHPDLIDATIKAGGALVGALAGRVITPFVAGKR